MPEITGDWMNDYDQVCRKMNDHNDRFYNDLKLIDDELAMSVRDQRLFGCLANICSARRPEFGQKVPFGHRMGRVQMHIQLSGWSEIFAKFKF